MKKILLAGATPFFCDHISFLLKLKGFDLVLVRNLEEAINMIEISRSLLFGFDLLIMEESELNDGTSEYFRFIKNMLGEVKILLIGRTDAGNRQLPASAPVLQEDNVFHCTVENLVMVTRELLHEDIAGDAGNSLSCHT